MPEVPFGEWVAENYERLWPELHDPAVIDPAVDFLAGLADGGGALEFGVGTGRLAVPLSRRGARVRGIELSEAMAGRLKAEPGAEAIRVTVGDFSNTRVDGEFDVVYLVRNTITNVTTQVGQVAAFENAAAHLKPGGHFVIENYIPNLRLMPPGETRHVFHATPDHVGVGEYDFASQIEVSHHWWRIDGELRSMSAEFRYCWPAELDLMARLAGLVLVERWADWDRSPFTGDSRSHISVWQKPTR